MDSVVSSPPYFNKYLFVFVKAFLTIPICVKEAALLESGEETNRGPPELNKMQGLIINFVPHLSIIFLSEMDYSLTLNQRNFGGIFSIPPLNLIKN